ncbi:MAG: malonic semialdehyde reductase [Alphaproteobacteria bacterium]|nr:malonic semialdehyde reductase [Alphaproteobacteria bacterium]
MTDFSNEHTLRQIFIDGRTHYHWQSKGVSDELLVNIYDLMKFGSTSANCCPLRIIFVKSQEAKEKLTPCLAAGNIEKTITAPVTAIFGHDMEFYKKLPKLFPPVDAQAWFVGNNDLIYATAFRNAVLQAAYFMMAARGLGLDCGPLSGFDHQKIDDTFFRGTSIRSNFLCNLGYGQTEKLLPRLPKLDFDEACSIL